MDAKTLELTAEITAAYVANNPVAPGALPILIRDVFAALTAASSPPPPPVEEMSPAVPIRRSIQPDFIICLEDGKSFKSMKRHLATKYGLTPAAYREKWRLPASYPMVAPNYAAARSALAKAIGLGAGARPVATTEPPAPPAEAATLAPEVSVSAATVAKAPRPRRVPAKAKSDAAPPKRKRNPPAIDPATDDFT
jgi:predicted transcriptional regulator